MSSIRGNRGGIRRVASGRVGNVRGGGSRTSSGTRARGRNRYLYTSRKVTIPVEVDKEDFYRALLSYANDEEKNGSVVLWTPDRVAEYVRLVGEYYAAAHGAGRREMAHYNRSRLFDLRRVNGQETLVKKYSVDDSENPVVLNINQYHSILCQVHEESGHSGRDKMRNIMRNKWYIPKWAVEVFLRCCPHCMRMKNNELRGCVVRPIRSHQFGERAQVDLIDYQSRPDGPFKFLMNLQDHLTKFCVLWPLRSKKASEVADAIFYIFSLWGAPRTLQSDNGREFVNAILNTMIRCWPGCEQVHGRPRYPQSQGSVERANGTVERMINAVLAKWRNNRWSRAAAVVMYRKNTLVHRTIGRSPYVALLGHPPPTRYGLRDEVGEEGNNSNDNDQVDENVASSFFDPEDPFSDDDFNMDDENYAYLDVLVENEQNNDFPVTSNSNSDQTQGNVDEQNRDQRSNDPINMDSNASLNNSTSSSPPATACEQSIISDGQSSSSDCQSNSIDFLLVDENTLLDVMGNDIVQNGVNGFGYSDHAICTDANLAPAYDRSNETHVLDLSVNRHSQSHNIISSISNKTNTDYTVQNKIDRTTTPMELAVAEHCESEETVLNVSVKHTSHSTNTATHYNKMTSPADGMMNFNFTDHGDDWSHCIDLTLSSQKTTNCNVANVLDTKSIPMEEENDAGSQRGAGPPLAKIPFKTSSTCESTVSERPASAHTPGNSNAHIKTSPVQSQFSRTPAPDSARRTQIPYSYNMEDSEPDSNSDIEWYDRTEPERRTLSEDIKSCIRVIESPPTAEAAKTDLHNNEHNMNVLSQQQQPSTNYQSKLNSCIKHNDGSATSDTSAKKRVTFAPDVPEHTKVSKSKIENDYAELNSSLIMDFITDIVRPSKPVYQISDSDFDSTDSSGDDSASEAPISEKAKALAALGLTAVQCMAEHTSMEKNSQNGGRLQMTESAEEQQPVAAVAHASTSLENRDEEESDDELFKIRRRRIQPCIFCNQCKKAIFFNLFCMVEGKRLCSHCTAQHYKLAGKVIHCSKCHSPILQESYTTLRGLVLCTLCNIQTNISEEREAAQQGQEKNAKEMIAHSNKKFEHLNTGDTVLVPVPKVDRGPLDNKNVIGKIIDTKSDLYLIGTPVGVIANWLPRNMLMKSDYSMKEEIPPETYSLREIASRLSQGGGQGVFKCNCRTGCNSKRCNCKRNGWLCTSRCHVNLSCENKVA